MNTQPKPRGRPKTLDRDQVLEAAMVQYWSLGPTEVSINDICASTHASKPSIYREFENDDGLKAAALTAYESLAIDPFLALFDAQQPIDQTIEKIIAYLTQDKAAMNLPDGCLFVTMRAHQDGLGPNANSTIEKLRTRLRKTISSWADVCIKNGAMRPDLQPDVIAHYIDTLHGGAMRMQKEKQSTAEIRQFLQFGFATLKKTN